MSQIGLFGPVNEIEPPPDPAITSLTRAARGTLAPLHYRLAETPYKRCANCANHRVYRFSKRYHKCVLTEQSRGPGTDIRANHVCDAWEPERVEAQTL